jgi:DNA-binding response OmpR family regulator
MTTLPTRILVTDDDTLALSAACRVLTSAGYDVISAINGEQTLQMVEEHHPDVMLLDVVLPDIDGTEICRRIKADPRTADIFIILLSGIRTSSDEQSQGMEGGADGYIARPIANRELLARIQAYLRVKIAEQRLREYSEHLEEAVKERTRELRDAQEQLVRARANGQQCRTRTAQPAGRYQQFCLLPETCPAGCG